MVPPSVLEGALLTSAPFAGGPTYPILCRAVATAVVAWASSVQLLGATVGVVGTGTVNGVLQFTATPDLLLTALQTGLPGSSAGGLAVALCAGLHTSLAGQRYVGQSVGVATGTDLSAVVGADVGTLAGLIEAAHHGGCLAAGGTGSSSPLLYQSVAAAVVVWWQTGIGVGAVTPAGPVGPTSGAGVSRSGPV